MKIFVFFILVFICCCNNLPVKTKIQKDGYTLIGKFINDTIFDGVVDYYDGQKLVYSASFKNNKKDGFAYNFYPNGKIKNQSFFELDKQNGNSIEYDSIGNMIYKDHYYYDRQIGPVYFYNKNGSIREYYFLNFEGETLIYRNYDSIKQTSQNPNNYFHMHISDALQDSTRKLQLFIYIIELPKYNLDYKICVKDTSGKMITVKDIPEGQVFFQMYLEPLKHLSNYCIQLNLFDSLTQKKQTILKEILFDK